MTGELLFAFFLLLLNGVFAMAEIALVSSNKFNLLRMKNNGNKGAASALALLAQPEKFLSAVQIAITLIGIIAGVVGGVSIADDLIPVFEKVAYINLYAEEAAYIVVISILTYFSVFIGELVPKAIAFKNPERVASLLAPFMKICIQIASPVVWVLSSSTSLFLKLIKIRMNEERPITQEDLKYYITLGQSSGSIEKRESELLNQIFAFGDKTVFSVMTPKKNAILLDKYSPLAVIKQTFADSGYSRFPVYENTPDNIVGVIAVKDFFDELLKNPGTLIQDDLLIEPAYFLKQTPALKALDIFKHSKIHYGIVIDEIGTLLGIVTLHDLMEGIFGSFPDYNELESDFFSFREDGSVFVAGDLKIEEVNEKLNLQIPLSSEYSTLAGFILRLVGSIPEVGEKIKTGDITIEIADLDGPRIDKVIISKSFISDTEVNL